MLLKCDPFPDSTIPSDTKATIIRQLGGEELLASIVDAGLANPKPLLGLHSTLYLVLAYDVMDDLKKAKPKLTLNSSFSRLREKSDLLCDGPQYLDDRDYTYSGLTNIPPSRTEPVASGCEFFLMLSRLAGGRGVQVNVPDTLVLGFGTNVCVKTGEGVGVTKVGEREAAIWKLLSEESDLAIVREQRVVEMGPGNYYVSETCSIVSAKDEPEIQHLSQSSPQSSLWIQKLITPRKGQFTRLRLCLFPTKETGFILAPKFVGDDFRSFNPQNSIMNHLPDSIFSQTTSTYGLRNFIGLPRHHPVVNFPAAEQKTLVETMKAKVEVMLFVLRVLGYANEAGLPQLNLGTTRVLIRHLHTKVAALKQWLAAAQDSRARSQHPHYLSKRAAEDAYLNNKCVVYPITNLSNYLEPLGMLRALREAVNAELDGRRVTVIVGDFMQEFTGRWYLMEVQKVATEVVKKPKTHTKSVFNKCAGDFCRLVTTFTAEQQSHFAQMLLRKGFTNASIYLSDRNPEQEMLWETHYYKILRKVILDERCDPASLSRAAKIMKGETPGEYTKASWGIDTVQVCYLCYLLYTKFEAILPSIGKPKR